MPLPTMLQPWQIYAGDDTQITLTLTNNGTPANLTAWGDWQACWRPAPGQDPTIPLQVDTSQLDEGRITVHIPASLTAVDGGVIRDGVWDLQARKDGHTKTFVRGEIEWIGDVTP